MKSFEVFASFCRDFVGMIHSLHTLLCIVSFPHLKIILAGSNGRA